MATTEQTFDYNYGKYSHEKMMISDLIKYLEEIKEESGDIEVRYYHKDPIKPEYSRMEYITEYDLKKRHKLCEAKYSSRMKKTTLDFNWY